MRLAKQADLNQQITEANKDRFGRNYLPSLELNAMATYQNEQITIPVDIPIPGFEAPAAPLNLNTALFTLRQWIYDGSQTHYQKLLEDANGRVKSGEIDVQQLEVKTAVMQQYFAALLKSKQLEIITDKESVLDKRLEEAKAAVENNLLLQADFNVLKAERVLLKQRKAELTYSLQENFRALQQLTQLNVDENSTLVVPEATHEQPCRCQYAAGRPTAQPSNFDFRSTKSTHQIRLFAAHWCICRWRTRLARLQHF
jgi:outer membrane protein TolC